MHQKVWAKFVSSSSRMGQKRAGTFARYRCNNAEFSELPSQKTFANLAQPYHFLFFTSDTGGLSDQKNNARQTGIIISTAATTEIV